MTLTAPREAKCAICGRVGPFVTPWTYPSIPPEKYFDDRVGKPVCSEACEAKMLAKKEGPNAKS